jgi:RNA polymerase sigma-B factor
MAASCSSDIGIGPATGPPRTALDGSDRTARRAAALVKLVAMGRLEPGEPRHSELRRQVIAEYMPYARFVAARYDAGSQLAEDLRQTAYVALVKAVDGFDPENGAAFLTYATPKIHGELKHYFRDTCWTPHVPRRIRDLSLATRSVADALMQQFRRAPTAGELAVALGVEPGEARDAIAASGLRRTVSLDLPADTAQGSGTTLGDLVGTDDPGLQSVLDRETLRPLLARLTPRERRILLLSFFQGMTQSQIGAELGVSQMQISRLLGSILQRLRECADAGAAPRAGARPAPDTRPRESASPGRAAA